MDRGNKTLLAASMSHDQAGGYAQYMVITLQNLLPRNQLTDFQETWYTYMKINCLPEILLKEVAIIPRWRTFQVCMRHGLLSV